MSVAFGREALAPPLQASHADLAPSRLRRAALPRAAVDESLRADGLRSKRVAEIALIARAGPGANHAPGLQPRIW
jgi:hypothetical protein